MQQGWRCHLSLNRILHEPPNRRSGGGAASLILQTGIKFLSRYKQPLFQPDGSGQKQDQRCKSYSTFSSLYYPFHVEHVRRMLREGDLQGAKMGKTWLVLKASVEKYQQDTKGLGKYDPKRGRR